MGMQKSAEDVNLPGKNQVKNGATKSLYFYNDDKLIILVHAIKHSIYTSKPWQVEEFLI